MTSSHQPRGRGRPRQRIQEASSLLNDVSATAVSNTTNVDISYATGDMQTAVTSLTTTISGRGRGRGIRLGRVTEVPDPHWTVSDLSIDQFRSNVRPSKPIEVGKIGNPITVEANYFPIIQFPLQGIANQYHLEIKNKRDAIMRREHQRAVYDIWLKKFCEKYPDIDQHKIFFDNQKVIFTFDQPLPGVNETGIVEQIPGPNRAYRQEDYEISIKQVGNPVDLSLLRSLKEFFETKSDVNIKLNELQRIKQMLSIALHEHCSSQAEFIFDRSFFSQPALEDKFGNWDLGLGKAVWRGFYSSLVFGKGTHQLLINLDVSHRVFMKKQPFIDFLCEVMLHSPCGKRHYRRERNLRRAELTDVLEFLDRNSNDDYDREIDFLLKHCENICVRSQVANQTIGYQIQGLGEAASRQTFNWKVKNVEVTVENYFQENHGVELRYPTLPTLTMRNGAFVPMELVIIKPSKVTQMTDEQRAILCLKSSLEPSKCYESIEEIRQNPKQQRFEQDPYITACNLDIDPNMLTISARILSMPDVIGNDRYRVTHEQCVLKGVWNNREIPFFKPTAFPSVWALINLSFSMNRAACEKFYDELSRVAAKRGIQCSAPLIYVEYNIRDYSIKQITDKLKEVMEQNDDCKFFIVILPEDKIFRDRIYGDIKELCELESGFGIVTQMIKLKKNEGKYGWHDSRLNNILMEINIKLGGINFIIDVHDNIRKFFSRDYRTMYVGVDLSHGPSGLNRLRSTVAVVASVGDIPIRYLKEMYVQERSPETRGESWEYVVDMKEIMESLIRQYEKHQGCPPHSIIIYRDGISTSEFDTVFEKELTAIREACVELSPVYRPYLTYIVVNKKHHTRFFPTDLKGNVVAGTVVDSPDVTNPTTYDFFLNSHYGEKGTSRPTHYHVLYDDNKLQPDQVQMLTYALCYLHARCARAISIPAPVKYANLLAFRASVYNVGNIIKSKRIVLSSKLAVDCPFFL